MPRQNNDNFGEAMLVQPSEILKNLPTPVQQIRDEIFEKHAIELYLKRDDLIHPEISGNKWRKLKYNLIAVGEQGKKRILTFGGAYSNHIAATAAAGKLSGFQTIGIIRGEELNTSKNHTLAFARENGMQLEFISREDYPKKSEADFIAGLHEKFGDFYLVPEGGANELGVKGCMEILNEVEEDFDFICAACGTGTSIAGIIASAKINQKVIGFPVLKGGGFLEKEITSLIKRTQLYLGIDTLPTANWQLPTDYSFGGYAKHMPELLEFIRDFKAKHGIELDFVYTGKMMFGIYDLMKKGFFPKGSRILAIHTGGLQGNLSIPDLFKTISDNFGI